MNFSPISSVSSCAIYKRNVSDQKNITVLLESVVRDIRFTLRSFRRTPLVALTIVATVGLGLGLIAVVFTILNAYVFRVDEVRNPARVVRGPTSAIGQRRARDLHARAV